MNFLVARKKPSHFYSDLSHAINAKHLSSMPVKCNAMLKHRIALSSSTVCRVMHEQMGIEVENDTTMLMPATSKDEWQLFRLFLRPFMALSSQSSVSHDT